MNEATKFFLSRCNELLHRKTFDTYRVSLHTPVSIFEELEKSIVKFSNNQIKRFDPPITSIVEEALSILENQYLFEVFTTGGISIKQIKDVFSKTIKDKDDRNIKSLSLLSRNIVMCNVDFKLRLFANIKQILVANDIEKYSQLDCFSTWLMSELLKIGYSRSFVKNRINRLSESLSEQNELQTLFDELIETFTNEAASYGVIFKIKHSNPSSFVLTSDNVIRLYEFPNHLLQQEIRRNFTELRSGELFVQITVQGFDFNQALRLAYRKISEIIDVNILHQSDYTIEIVESAIVFHENTLRLRMLPIAETLDGQYDYQESEFHRFVENYRRLPEGSSIRDKIRSAIRFYKLGNESVELEHKILNYWIGFEQLFSSETTSEDSIKRIKSFFIAINGTYYLQRRVYYLVNQLSRIGVKHNSRSITKEDLFRKSILDEIQRNSLSDPFVFQRLSCYSNLLFDNKTLRKSFESHAKRLNQHLTRIYRIRNEIVHEGKTEAELELVAGHLRHYLLFSIEQITHEHSTNLIVGNLDDVYVYFENIYEQIKQAQEIKQVFDIKDYQGYME